MNENDSQNEYMAFVIITKHGTIPINGLYTGPPHRDIWHQHKYKYEISILHNLIVQMNKIYDIDGKVLFQLGAIHTAFTLDISVLFSRYKVIFVVSVKSCHTRLTCTMYTSTFRIYAEL